MNFNVGDKVLYIPYTTHSIFPLATSTIFTVEKVHKNGNFVVNGARFRQNGEGTSSSLLRGCVVLATKDKLAEREDHIRAKLAQRNIGTLAEKLSRISQHDVERVIKMIPDELLEWAQS